MPGRLLVEPLEDRTVPSTFTVVNLGDTGTGSGSQGDLRYCIAQANATPNVGGPDVIDFAPGLQGTIRLTSGELTITDPTGGLTIDGPGADRLAVSGNDASRVFDISSGAQATIEGLTITHGRADGSTLDFPSYGGGILNFGDLTLSDVVVSHNQAIGDINANPLSRGPGNAFGGGVYNGFTIDPDRTVHLGILTVEDNSIFTHNQALGDSASNDKPVNFVLPGVASGGGIANEGKATVTGSQFTSNLAQGGNNWTNQSRFAGVGAGGAIASLGPSVRAQLIVSGSSFSDNQAVGGNGNSATSLPGFGVGGAIFSHSFTKGADLTVSDSTFSHNRAIGGNDNRKTAPGFGDPNLAAGGGIFIAATIPAAPPNNGPVMISGSTFDHNQAIGGQGLAASNGGDGNGGGGHGGGIGIGFAGPIATNVHLSNSTFEHNQAIGGQARPGGTGGDAEGGGIFNEQGAVLTVTDNSVIDQNQALGGSADASGPASNGGNGLGGGLYNGALSTVNVTASPITVNLSITDNQAIGAPGSNGGTGGDGQGGGFYNAGALTITGTATAPIVISQNTAQGGDGGDGGDGGNGLGGGLFNGGTLTITGTAAVPIVISQNQAIGGSGGPGGNGGDGLGGGLFNGGSANLSYTTIEFNLAEGGAAGSGDGSDGQGAGGGAYNAGTKDALAVLDSIFCDNDPDNISGLFTDDGSNIFC